MKLISRLTSTDCSLITLETHRRVSVTKPDNETQTAADSSFRRNTKDDSRSITSLETEEGGLHRQDTSWSAQTLVRPPASASMNGSSTRSTLSPHTLLFVDSAQLRSAVEEKDIPWVQRLIREGRSGSEVSACVREPSLSLSLKLVKPLYRHSSSFFPIDLRTYT